MVQRGGLIVFAPVSLAPGFPPLRGGECADQLLGFTGCLPGLRAVAPPVGSPPQLEERQMVWERAQPA